MAENLKAKPATMKARGAKPNGFMTNLRLKWVNIGIVLNLVFFLKIVLNLVIIYLYYLVYLNALEHLQRCYAYLLAII